jgi:hypothetical protein
MAHESPPFVKGDLGGFLTEWNPPLPPFIKGGLKKQEHFVGSPEFEHLLIRSGGFRIKEKKSELIHV